ncbi:outer membrane protein transport protein [Flavobacterium sp. MK4S-17]|uniref:outer membrane protein transport protein n=1 Tax=Flavobacterium sp. MK4S-17 TaxID=2543737 RepID=UPI00135BE718|nr:outer membrane protein transport protein [Flavobacterium sp. MK4S-17]
MKKYLLFAFFILSAVSLYAQRDENTAADAVRYAIDNMNGTARFRSMSGAFGAVGGDVSSMTVNPAGSAIYNFNSGTGSLTSYNISNNSNYFGTKSKENDNAFELNQLGAVFVFNNTNPDSFMQKFTLGFNYDNTNNFDNSIFSKGVNPTNSINNYFLSYANGFDGVQAPSVSTLENSYFEDLPFGYQQAYLGYYGFVINPNTDPAGLPYVANGPNGGNYYQENYLQTSGYNGKVALSFATQLKQRLYLGANINVHFTDYIQTTSIFEDTNNPNVTGLQSIRFNTEKYTYGGGVSFNLGAIYKVTEQFRAGVAYESPTWLTLQNEVTQSLRSYCPECSTNNDTFIVNPQVTMVSDDYTIKTPSKWTGSLAYIFGRSGLLSVDASIKDYSKTEYKSSRYNGLNDQLSDQLGYAAEVRVGGEVRIKNVSLRGGYRFEQSPYENGRTMGDLWGLSGGLGFSFGGSRLDLAYSYFQRKMEVPVVSAGFTDAARVKSDNNNVTLSYTLDL